MRFIKKAEIVAKVAFTAVVADLFYIIYRCTMPVCTIDDMRFVNAVPEMLELMLLTVSVITAFMALATYMEVSGSKK